MMCWSLYGRASGCCGRCLAACTECDNVLAPVCHVITLVWWVLAAKAYDHAHAGAALKRQEAGARVPGRLWIIAVCLTTVHGSLLHPSGHVACFR